MSVATVKDDELTISQVFSALRRQWIVLALTIAIMCTIAIVAIFRTEPVYRAEALVKAVQPLEAGGGLSSMLGQLGGGLGSLAGLSLGGQTDEITKEAIAVLKSRGFVREFLETHQIVPLLFKNSWDAQRGTWKTGLKRVPTEADAYKVFTTDVFDAFKDRKSSFIKVQIDWTNREQAALWANEVVALLNKRMRARAIQEADETIKYLDQEYQRTSSVAVRQAVASMMESQLKLKTIAVVRTQYTFQFLDSAVVPDDRAVLRPRPVLYIVAAIVAGLLLGAVFALLWDLYRKPA
jgi:capsular polysaccharide biosynthesis protein